MSNYAEWIDDMLGAAKEVQNPTAIHMIECCGKGCAARKNADTAMAQLKSAASNCKTLADYVSFLSGVMPASVTVTETEDGIIFRLGKSSCTCPLATEISQNADMLCECTRGHEKTVWSAFFGKPIEVEIVESFLRGGKDCVTKIKIDMEK